MIQAYLYAGKPILCGVRGDAVNLVEHAGAGVPFTPQDAESLATAVGRLRNMPAERLREMGAAGRTFYHDRLSFRTGVDQIESIFQNLMDEPDGCAMSILSES